MANFHRDFHRNEAPGGIGLLPPAFRAIEELSQQGNAHIERRQEDIFQQVRALLDAIVNGICLVFSCGNDRSNVLEKIDAALIARAAVPLLVVARRTRVAQRRVASRAEAGYIARFRVAFWAFHKGILPGRAPPIAAGRASLRPQR